MRETSNTHACRIAPAPPLAIGIIAAVAALKLTLHLVVLAVTQFGVHRDEFLYASMGQHLRLWSMDFPPMIAMLANISRGVFGNSLAAVRVLPAVEGTVLIVVTALTARQLGGRWLAQLLAMLSVLAAPLFLRSANLFQPVVLDELWWTVALYALIRVVRSGDRDATRDTPKWWIAFGVACGLGLLTKFSVIFFAIAALLAIVATPMRRALATPWPWVAAAIMLVIGSPSIVGQFALHFPVVLQMHDLQAQQLEHVSFTAFLSEQPFMLGPVALIVAVIGAGSLLFWDRLVAFRVVGWTCIFAFVILLLLHGKAYYIGPIYPTLFAAGAVRIEHWQSDRVPMLAPVLRWSAVAGVVLFSLVLLPISVPILSPSDTAAYASRIGAAPALRTNRGAMDRLPQDLADMLGWEGQARGIARAFASLPPGEQSEAVIIAGNYGEAGAAEFYAARYGLPPVVSPAGSFWFFGPGTRPGRVAIVIGVKRQDLAHYYSSVQDAGTIESPWSVSEERNVPILIARGAYTTLQQIWPSLAGRN